MLSPEEQQAVIAKCPGPYKTTKQAIIALLAACLELGKLKLYYAALVQLVYAIEDRIKSKNKIPVERIESALRSLAYERVVKSCGDGHLSLHSAYAPKVIKESPYNAEKRKIEEKEKQKVKGFVYCVMWDNDKDHVKIGYTTNPPQRFASFLTSSPHCLRLVGLSEADGPQRELEMHKRFKEYHVNGEWFRCEGLLRDYLSTAIDNVAFRFYNKYPNRVQITYF